MIMNNEFVNSSAVENLFITNKQDLRIKKSLKMNFHF